MTKPYGSETKPATEIEIGDGVRYGRVSAVGPEETRPGYLRITAKSRRHVKSFVVRETDDVTVFPGAY
jgi:hypothetical protein